MSTDVATGNGCQRTAKRKTGQVRILTEMPLADVRPSPENDQLYKPVDPADPAIVALAESISDIGIREPLVVTDDGWLLSGHRRRAAAELAGLEVVPVRVEPICREDDLDGFIVLLREYNRQRDKTNDEKLREELDPKQACFFGRAG